jgi:DNA-binding HxlR family transcriptional regulator
MKAMDFKRSCCPITNLLDVIGDKWTLLVVRDLFLDKHRFSEFADSPEKMPTNILADRLKRLEDEGIIQKDAYQAHPVRYQYSLTAKGKELEPVLKEMVRWGLRNVKGTKSFLQSKS